MNNDTENATKILNRLISAFKDAEAHVFRQQVVGKHEQDRKDAKEWIQKYRCLSDCIKSGKMIHIEAEAVYQGR